MNPKVATAVLKPSLTVSTFSLSARGTRGVSAVRTVMMMFCSCSTWLCLRLCSRAAGVRSTSEVRNTAVPFTRVGGRSEISRTKSFSGGDSRLVFNVSRLVPRTHVYIMANMPAPSRIGTKPPSKIFRRLALKKIRSRQISGAATAAAPQIGHFHSFHMTMKASDVSTDMVAETAMP